MNYDSGIPYAEDVRSLDRAELRAEIESLTRRAAEPFVRCGNQAKADQLWALAEAAMADGALDANPQDAVKKFKLDLLRAGRVDAPNPYPASRPATAQVLEASLAHTLGVPADRLGKRRPEEGVQAGPPELLGVGRVDDPLVEVGGELLVADA
ncbi:MAG TPA: hypothetical protein VM597_37185, partial [Gemmataceae bacterium]|nr:hypothetical protein [Gemmataceae bacterium]